MHAKIYKTDVRIWPNGNTGPFTIKGVLTKQFVCNPRRWTVWCLDDEGELIRATSKEWKTPEEAAKYAATVARSRKPEVQEVDDEE